MKNLIVIVALVFAGSTAFATTQSTTAKLKVDKAISCFVQSLKPEAFTAAWMDGGKKEFMKKVKGNENYPVLGDQLGNLVSMYLSDAAFKSASSGDKAKWSAMAADANQENTVAKALWSIQQQINPSFITEKGQKMMAKWEPELKALAS